jgi:hypothetical protein
MQLTYLDKFVDWLLNIPLLELVQSRDKNSKFNQRNFYELS